MTLHTSPRPTVLVIDDTPTNIALVHAILAESYNVKVANSGARGLAIAQAEPTPDLILLDIMMPVMDGLETCRRLKADARLRDIPVIFLSGNADAEDEEAGLAAGGVDYVAKPINPALLLRRIETQMRLQTVERVLRQSALQGVAAPGDRDASELAMAEFETVAAHDIRSGLSMIKGYASLLKKKSESAGDAQAIEFLTAVLDGARRVASLATRWRDTARDFRKPLVLAGVDMSALVHELAGEMSGAAARVEVGALPPAWGDAGILRRILAELLANASTAVAETALPQVRVSGRVEGTETVYTVCDNGPGLIEAVRTDVFPPLQKPHAGEETVAGYGMGLFLASQGVRRHGGRFWLETGDSGVQASFALPAAPHTGGSPS